MQRIKMIQTALAATSYFQPKPYFKGKVYNVDNDIAYSFIKQGVAILEKDDTEEYTQQSPPQEFNKKIINPSIRRGRPPKSKI